MDQEKFGKLIKEIRKTNNLTQKQLADKYNVTYQAVSKWENGVNMPDISLIRQISKDFNISLDELFDGFKIKIPSEFKIMSDEIVNIKYPNGNTPSLVYTNDKTTINVALVMNDVTMKNSQIEEYVKTMESTYKNYSKDVKLNF